MNVVRSYNMYHSIRRAMKTTITPASPSNIIDGILISQSIKTKLRARIVEIRKMYNIDMKPGLAVVLVGSKKDSETYVRMKQIAAEELDIHFELHRYDDKTTEQELLQEIERLNDTSHIHGIIVQLPLPQHIDKRNVITKLSILKDVDGFNALNIGTLALDGYSPYFVPCTPRGVMELFKAYNIEVKGKHCVVLGKSNIVGLPMSLMLIKENATVTICNSETINEPEIVRSADIIISAVGIAKLVKEDWVKPGAIVIDVGINCIPDNTRKCGYRLVGDVDFENVKNKARMITPVPGGVGPMTVAMLMQATVDSFERHLQYQTHV
jgi:5,10-methylene-tetrahydrofolate dehydrogenase/methenyl tetrahydrofolate cyclohydrolase